MSRSIPAAASGTTMSLNRIAASTRCRRTGCRVISVTSSGRRHDSSIGGTVCRDGEEVATGRLVLLYDPDGQEAWEGTLRLVTYVTAELEPELASDPLVPTVGWSWLTDALAAHEAAYANIGGTVTQTSSTRFGALAGPPAMADL